VLDELKIHLLSYSSFIFQFNFISLSQK